MEDLRRRIYARRVRSPYRRSVFVPNDRFETLFTEEVTTQIRNIRPNINVNESAKVIATLATIRKLNAEILRRLDENRFTDQDLPVELDGGNEAFNAVGMWEDLVDFEEKQWMFLSPSFGGGEHQQLNQSCPLPIIQCSDEGLEGGYSEVYKVKVHHAHLWGMPPPTEENNPYFAMKKIKSDCDKEYRQEREALQRIQRLQHHHLITTTASFSRGQDHYFLFPWANGGDLWSWWKENTDLKRTPGMVLWVLEQMEGLAGGVNAIHTQNEADENGRHGDLKPQNIVIFEDQSGDVPQRTLRITDAGLARFHEEVTSKRMEPTDTYAGSIQYGPPQQSTLKNGLRKISRRYDMWSLGCTLLEFVVWVLGGYTEVVKFRDCRRDKCKQAEFYRKRYGRYDVQPQVKRYMRNILNDKRCHGDNCFRDVVKIIRDYLLKTNERNRITSDELEQRLHDIVRRGRHRPSYLCGQEFPSGFDPNPISPWSRLKRISAKFS